jgi:hypothetical protein
MMIPSRTKQPLVVIPHCLVYITVRGGGGDDSSSSTDNDNVNDVAKDCRRAERTEPQESQDATAAADATADGGDSPSKKDMEIHDSHDDDDDAEAPVNAETAPSVGVKQHHNKKSNAVGDPDGEDSSDDEDNDDYLSDWDESLIDEDSSYHQNDLDSVLERVQVEVEYTLEEDEEDETSASPATSANAGGVGVRLGQRFKKNRNAGSSRVDPQSSSKMERHLQAAWEPYVFLPPPADWTYLHEHSRTIDSDGKTRLDRRTLYAGLLLEWTGTATKTSYRKFLDQDLSQSLQAALSLATQPAWRKSLQRPNAIRLYDNTEVTMKGCTLAMQETIAMALVSA